MILFRSFIIVTLVSLLVNQSYGATSSRFSYDRTEDAREVSSFWSQHKMGVGVQAAGFSGLMGGIFSVHFHPQWAVDLSYGGGTHFQSFGFRLKRMLLMSSPLNPYYGFGFHRWSRSTSRPFNSGDVSPAFIGERFMSAEDKRTGRIDLKLVHASLGLQYIFTQGSMKGYGLFFEGLILMDAEELTTVPTASLGMNYFF